MKKKVDQSRIAHKVLFLPDLDDLNKIGIEHNRIYWGSETCDQNMPDIESTLVVWNHCRQEKRSLTIITPPCTEDKIKYIKALLKKLINCGWNDEVVANDLGVLSVAKALGLEPVCGRLLAQVFRDPRRFIRAGKYVNCFGFGFNQSSIDFFRHYFGVRRLEIQPGVKAFDISEQYNDNLYFSIYTPLSLITRTRLCLVDGFHSQRSGKMVKDRYPERFCSRSCNKSTLKLKDPSTGEDFVLSGNAVYFFNPFSYQDGLGKNNLRIVDNSRLLT